MNGIKYGHWLVGHNKNCGFDLDMGFIQSCNRPIVTLYNESHVIFEEW